MLIRCLPAFFSKVYVKLFKGFHVVVVCSAIKLDGFYVVKERMEFGDVYMLLNAHVNKEILVLVKRLEGVLEVDKGFITMTAVLHKIHI